MKLNFRETITWLLSIAFVSAIISDSIYGKVEVAKEYLIGQFIEQIFRVSMSFAFILCLFWLMLELFLKEFFETMNYNGNIKRSKTSSRRIKR